MAQDFSFCICIVSRHCRIMVHRRIAWALKLFCFSSIHLQYSAAISVTHGEDMHYLVRKKVSSKLRFSAQSLSIRRSSSRGPTFETKHVRVY